MSDLTMYKPQNNGPHTTLAAIINASQTSITVEDSSVLPPDLPNVLTIGTEEDAELVKVTSISGNILAVERGYNNTTAKQWDAGAWIYRAITAQDIEALQERVGNAITTMTAKAFEALTMQEKIALFGDGSRIIMVESEFDPDNMTDLQKAASFLMPVGHGLLRFDATSPAALYGFGTWEATLQGRAPIGAGTADSGTVYTVGQKLGEETHLLTEAELPELKGSVEMHATDKGSNLWRPEGVFAGSDIANYYNTVFATGNANSNAKSLTVIRFAAGGSQRHNIMQPSEVVCFWRRVA